MVNNYENEELENEEVDSTDVLKEMVENLNELPTDVLKQLLNNLEEIEEYNKTHPIDDEDDDEE